MTLSRIAAATIACTSVLVTAFFSGGPVAAGSAASETATPPARPALVWHACDTRFRCATLRVPLEYAHPSRGSLRLAVVELESTGAHPVGDLVMNPGGPGASGVQFLEQASFPAALRSEFDLVSFDPRGVGESDPVTCEGASGVRQLLGLDPAPSTPSQIGAVVRATRGFDAACADHTPRALLADVGSAATVEDMDRLRQALGQSKLDYLGFSYGTYLGELYAERYPSHVRAMVLDGVFDPALSTQALDAQQAEGFQRDLDDFFAWCPTDSACATELPKGPKVALDDVLASLAAGRRLVGELKPRYGGTQPVTLGVAETALAGSLYSEQSWPDLAEALAEAGSGDGTLLLAIADSYEGLQPNGSFGNQLAANTAINCLDRPSPTRLSSYVRLASRLARLAPDFGASEAWGSLACAYWPVHPEGVVGPIHAPGSPPILVVGSTGDPATPYSWAQSVAHQLVHARLLTRDGPGHTAYFFSACVRSDVDRYLVTLVLPPEGAVCPTSIRP